MVEKETLQNLTPREKDVIKCLREGLITSEEIAKKLGLIKTYVDSIFGELYFDYGIEGKQQRARLVWEVMK